MSCDGAVLCLVGVPCSGKTRLCQILAGFLSERGFEVAHIEFDAIVEECNAENKLSAWRASRKVFPDKILAAAEELHGRCHLEQKRFVILADDTNHLSSMRQEIARVCYKVHLTFLELALVVPDAEIAAVISSDAQRGPKSVGEKTIRHIAETMELPDSDKCRSHNWECDRMVIDYRKVCPEDIIGWIVSLDFHPVVLYTQDSIPQNHPTQEKTEGEILDLWLRQQVAIQVAKDKTLGKKMSCIKRQVLSAFHDGRFHTLDDAKLYFEQILSGSPS